MRKYSYFAFQLSMALTCQFGLLYCDEGMEIDSKEARYDGKTVSLVGSVHLEHELGSISADEVVLHPAAKGKDKKSKFGSVSVNHNVVFDIKGGGELRCAKAELDRETMVGKYYGALSEFVTYTEMIKGKQNSLLPLFVKSKSMEMMIGKDNDAKSTIQKILAFEDVSVDYNGDFVLKADRSTYQRDNSYSDCELLVKTLPGTIFLEMDTKGTKCKASNKNGDLIDADAITVDINNRCIGFIQPEGLLFTAFEEDTPISFSSDSMEWSLGRKRLKLSQNVKVDQSGIGNFRSNKDVNIYYTEVKGKKELTAIESFGHTSLYYRDAEKKASHRLNCYGKVLVDHKNMETTMESLWDFNGKAIEGSQVHFHGAIGEMKADKLKIIYKLIDDKMVPKKVILEGNVAMLNNKGLNGPDKTLHYALADKVEYRPDLEEIYFSSHTLHQGKKRRVLFYDKVNQVQISAPALKVKRDSVSKKELIQGVGDVRLSFLESEFDQIKSYFKIKK